jgi:co-chaperonin GroES (HSP10)
VKFKVTGNRVLVEVIDETLPGGLVQPEKKQVADYEADATWRILEIGEGYYLPNGQHMPITLSVGDEVVIAIDGSLPIPACVAQGRKIRIANAAACVCVVHREPNIVN